MSLEEWLKNHRHKMEYVRTMCSVIAALAAIVIMRTFLTS
jgi:hypothetical protein